MEAYYSYVLAVHIIFVVSWMAGLFYGVRLFIYHTESNLKPEPERSILLKEYAKITARLWNIITIPAMVLTLLAGLTMLYIMPNWLNQSWMHVKLAFVIGLVVYHFICQRILKQLRAGVFKWSSNQLRLWNEVATIILVAIVFTVVLKSAMHWIYGLVGLLMFSILIMTAVKIYKRYREKNEN
ncbi:MAG: CopD family protein [Pedobacter sp.]|nr:MAG: CopD family protein [Pedobacter sp.]